MGAGRLRQAAVAFSETARTPNLRRAQLSYGGAFTAEWALPVVLGILAFRQGGAAAVGVVAMARMLPSALLAPVAAIIVDRRRRERVLLAVGVARGAALLGAGGTLALTGSPYPAYVLATVATLAHTLYRPAHSALLPSLCETPAQLASANVVRGLIDSLSALAGPLAAGLLVAPVGVDGLLVGCGAVALWSAWLIGRLEYEAPPRLTEAPAGDAAREAVAGFAVMVRQPDVGLLSLLLVVQTVTRGAFVVFAVVVAIELLGTGEAGVGLLTAAFGAGAVAGSFAASLLIGGSGFARWFGFGVALWGLPFAVLAAVSSEGLALGLLALVGVANAVVDATVFTMLNRLVADEVMGRFFAALESMFQLGVAVGSIAVPALIALLGTRGALVAVGLVGPVAALLSWRRLRAIDVKLRVADRVVAILRRVAMFRPLPIATVAQLAAKVSGERVEPGTLVLREGAAGDEFYVIAKGRAEVLRGGERICVLGEGECFGEIAVLGRRTRTSTVRADGELRLLRLSGADLVTAVTGYTPSRSAARTLIEQRTS